MNKLKILVNGIIKENPVLVLVLGTCPTLATSTSVSTAIGMGLAATIVRICSNSFISLLRKIILLIPLIYILPFFFADKVFAVFLAEPIADITAALSTSTVFLLRFGKILKRKLEEGEGPVLS